MLGANRDGTIRTIPRLATLESRENTSVNGLPPRRSRDRWYHHAAFWLITGVCAGIVAAWIVS